MTRNASSIARLGLAGSIALLLSGPAVAATRPDQPVQAWPAMQDRPVGVLLEQAQSLPNSDMTVEDQPYCAANTEIHATLQNDFGETRVEATRDDDAVLWGSEQMGTWTLVAPRSDDSSCIIASGIGFRAGRDIEVYYRTAGLD
ncbi:hypothetical protein [Paracoccus spongiarum]|uniref:Uncharacterized protein n=1 Tax=Paracoccus spongiarum TaxID=3064387 RepID=A0ABT9JD08_9RHOB|nr:hypothetical protein [Paracoccus sp. 2205BS29-5]MDP5306992.1 hypothetical protein [Paracoccus sp. 2205BS29-5]